MKIAIIGANQYDCKEYHLKEELQEQKYEVEIFDIDTLFNGKLEQGLTLMSMSYVEFRSQRLLKRVLNYRPDLIIGIYRHIQPSFVKKVKEEKIKIIHINPDALTTFQRQQLFVEPYDAYFTKDPFILKFMKHKMGLNVFQYQEAFNPRIHKKPDKEFEKLEKEINIDVLAFGTLYPYRNRMLHILKENGINLTIYGGKAKYFDPYLDESFQNKGIYGEEKANILNGAKIVFNNFHYAEVESVNNKFFEITGSGAFQICDYKPILSTLLPIDPKLVSFETINEAEILIKYYLRNPEQRYEIRKTLYQYFLENYTYKNMATHILNHI